MPSFEHMLSAAVRLAAAGAGLVILFMMMVGVADVAGRYLLNAPLSSAFELTGLSMVLVVFGGLASCGWVGGHVVVNVLEGVLSKPSGRLITALVHGIGAVLMLTIAWRSADVALDYFASGEVSNMLRAPLYPFVVAVAAGTLLYGLVLALQAIQTVRKRDGDAR